VDVTDTKMDEYVLAGEIEEMNKKRNIGLCEGIRKIRI
jgi:hypothetical protein